MPALDIDPLWAAALDTGKVITNAPVDSADEGCPDCDGDGYYEVDGTDRRGEHITRAIPCRTCRHGDASALDDEFEDLHDPEPDLDAEVAW